MARPVVLEVAVPSDDLSYPVLIGGGLLDHVGAKMKRATPRARTVALISDENVMPLYGERVQASLVAEGFEVVRFVVPAGEQSKTPARMLELVSGLVTAGLSRSDAVLALGGGVVGDLAGFVSSLFMRGIDVVQCPTSLLAQVDASVGGKVAVDLPEGKNLLGTFQFPRCVLIDPTVLDTLPDEELGCGVAEMLKHGALFDPEHFDALQSQAEAIYDRDDAVLGPLVATSVALKAACVIRDPLEKSDAGKGRVVLNLGHTVGHALEAADGYALKHGQAVGLGLLAAARISLRRGLTAFDLEGRIRQALTALRLPVDLDERLSASQRPAIAEAMAHDKKRGAHSKVTYIGLARLGEPRVLALTPEEILDTLST
ncbi:MAG: 3-dehydroquinate synthase [Myxococcota bacterium]